MPPRGHGKQAAEGLFCGIFRSHTQTLGMVDRTGKALALQQFSDSGFQRLNGGLKRRIGTLNCGHVAMPIILGVNAPQYTDAELQAFKDDNAQGIEY